MSGVPNNAARQRAALLFNTMLRELPPPSEEKLIALLKAIEVGDTATAMQIIKKDVRLINTIPAHEATPVNPYHHYSSTPFCMACRHSNLELVKFMLDHDADVNKNGTYGEVYTPLHAAIYDQSQTDPDITYEEFIHDSHERDHTEIVRLLFAHGAVVPADPDLVRFACKNLHLESLRMLLEHGADPNDGILSGLDFLLSYSESPKEAQGDTMYVAMLNLLCSTPGADATVCKKKKAASKKAVAALNASAENSFAKRAADPEYAAWLATPEGAADQEREEIQRAAYIKKKQERADAVADWAAENAEAKGGRRRTRRKGKKRSTRRR